MHGKEMKFGDDSRALRRPKGMKIVPYPLALNVHILFIRQRMHTTGTNDEETTLLRSNDTVSYLFLAPVTAQYLFFFSQSGPCRCVIIAVHTDQHKYVVCL